MFKNFPQFGTFKDPWIQAKVWRVGPDSKDFDYQEYRSAQSEKVRKDVDARKERGQVASKDTNRLGEEGEKQQRVLIEALEEYQSKKGMDVKRLIDKAKNCKEKWQLKELEDKIGHIAEAEYQRQLTMSGAFDPIDDSEELSLAREKKDLGKWFTKQKLYGDESSKLDTLVKLEENLQDRKKFREKLKKECKKSGFVKAEYFRRLNFLPFIDSKEKLLSDVLAQVKEVEDSPSPVQYEFNKLQKETKGNKNTEEIKKKVLEAFKKRRDAYKKLLMDNKQFFGGKMVDFPEDGSKVPEALKEFLEYEETRENFADMDDKLKKLPGVIAERKKVYEKRDSLLAKLPEDSKKRIKAYTDEMRFHTLQAYIPELEENAESNGVNMLEFSALLEMSEHKGIPLFTGEEIAERKRDFKSSTLKEQEAELFLLKSRDLEKRREDVQNYLAVPAHLTKDRLEVFKASDAFTRKRMLREARDQEKRERENPLDFSYVDHVDSETIKEMEQRLQSEKGREALEDLVDETQGSKAYKVLDNIGTMRQRVYGIGVDMKQNDISQVDYYMKDLARWMRRSQNVFKDDYNHDNPRDEWQYQEGQAIYDRYQAGRTQYSSGESGKLRIIKNSDLESDSDILRHDIKNARYATDLLLLNEEGKDEHDLLGTLDEKFIKFSKMYINQMMMKLFGEMGLNPALLSVLSNSLTMKKAVAKGSVMEEFDNYTMPANNTDHYVDEMANAA